MKATLLLYEPLVPAHQSSFGYASYRLARELHERDLLECVLCRTLDPSLELPADKVHVMRRDRRYNLAARAIFEIGSRFAWFDARRRAEELFDRYALSRVPFHKGGPVFATRPLMLGTFARAKAAGCPLWMMASVPHPLQNYALGRNEEIRHGLDRSGPITDERRTERLTRALQLADRIVTSHPTTGEYVYRSFLHYVEPEKLRLLKHYFPLENIEGAQPRRLEDRDPARTGVDFLHVSHMHFLKGVVYVLDAWRRFKQHDRTESRLLLVGTMDRRLREVVDRDYADLPGVEVRGFVPDLKEAFREADVFLSPSVTDAGPLTIIEAMATGLPVISSRNCGFASILTEGRDGFTYEYNDVPKLAGHFAWFAEHRDELPGMSAAALENARGHSMDEYLQELISVFEEPAD